jgi:uncharacterized coiled-coil protein SlyX
MVRADHRTSIRWHFFLSLLLPVFSVGCAIVPRSRLDEYQRLTQTLRSENARLQDRVLALQGQNRDYADRAVDDLRRSAAQEQAIERLEQSVQAYQEDRDQLHEAYERLTSSLGMRPSPTAAVRAPAARRGRGIEPRRSAPEDDRPKDVTGVDDEETHPEPPREDDDRTGP